MSDQMLSATLSDMVITRKVFNRLFLNDQWKNCIKNTGRNKVNPKNYLKGGTYYVITTSEIEIINGFDIIEVKSQGIKVVEKDPFMIVVEMPEKSLMLPFDILFLSRAEAAERVVQAQSEMDDRFFHT